MSDPALLTLVEAATAIAAGTLSSQAATEACLARIETWQPAVNAFIRIDRDRALAQARERDRERAQGRLRGPLHGVPLAHKDLLYRAGAVSTAGSAIRRDWVAETTATVLARLDKAGAVELGTLNMAEFAAGPTGHNIHFGHCRNPWNPAHITGGSSSGSGAVTAARLAFGSIGSDTGGSIRMPAAACGVVGIKATYGRVSRYGAAPRSWTLDHIGPLARTAADCARMLTAIAGADENDATASAVPVPNYEAGLGTPVAGLRIGVAKSLPVAVDGETQASLDRSRRDLERLGLLTVAIELPDLEPLFDAANVIIACEAASLHRPWLEQRPQDYANQVRIRTEPGFYIPATQYIDALRLRAVYTAQFLAQTLADADLLLLPALPMVPPTIEESDVERFPGPQVLASLARFSKYTRPFNLLGLPAVSVPCGFAANGVPLAFQLVGRPFDEALLLRVAHAYQQVTEHHRRVPTLTV
jgi:aspartyl-tRNA(Asn)/glutamyl-tRNA(Gln) amidotransferase subunit A